VSTLDLLYSCRSDVLEVLQGQKLSAHFKGIMSGTIPSLKNNMHFVSAVPELEDGRLQSMCSLLRSRFKPLDVFSRSDDEIQLFCTLLRTGHFHHRGGPKQAEPQYVDVDANSILQSEELKNYDFGEVDVAEVQLSEMKMNSSLEEWRYKNVGGFSLAPEKVIPEEVKTDGVVEG